MKTLNKNNRLPLMGYRYDDLFQALVTQEGVEHTARIVGVGPDSVAHFVMDSMRIVIHYKNQPLATLFEDGNGALIWGDPKERPVKDRMNRVLAPLGWKILRWKSGRGRSRTWKLYHPQTGQYRDYRDGMLVERVR